METLGRNGAKSRLTLADALLFCQEKGVTEANQIPWHQTMNPKVAVE